jgi:hypothetical protein
MKTANTLILLILEVNFELNSKTSSMEMDVFGGSFLRIMHLLRDSEWSKRATSALGRFNCVTISEKLSLLAPLNSSSNAACQDKEVCRNKLDRSI